MPDSTPDGTSDGGDDEFDKIVEGLDLEMPPPEPIEQDDVDSKQDRDQELWRQPEPKGGGPIYLDEDSIAYRTPPPRPKRPPNKARTWALVTIFGAPGLLVLATIVGILLPRVVVLATALIFVAAVIYLISQLPERGPSHPDWPDDGAVL
ncbi:MAG: hypothetical protein ABIR57_06860 [Aeromicrobium sp.]